MLSLPPVLMERYLAAAEQVSHTAIFGAAADEADAGEAVATVAEDRPEPVPCPNYDVTGLSLANAFHAEHRVPVEADYVIHAVAGGTRPAGSEPIRADAVD